MFKTTLLALASTTVLATNAMADISLVSVHCVGNKINVSVDQPDYGWHTVNVFVTSSGQPMEQQSKKTIPAPISQNLGFTFSPNLVPFGVITVFTNNLEIDQIYRNGCPNGYKDGNSSANAELFFTYFFSYPSA